MSYHFPKSLEMLRLYAMAKGIDVNSLKSDRDALNKLRVASGLKVRFPKHGLSCYKPLRKLHVQLFPNIAIPTANRVRRVYSVGTLGPASPPRSVDAETFRKIAARYENTGT